MKARRARGASFVVSAVRPADYPDPGPPEIAFAGRSNVGKSSLINALVGRPGLARTSSTPGRTRLLNWFRIEPPSGPPLCFVDLPGYGYAKVPRSLRESWRPMVESYLGGGRPVLRGVVLLVDARRGAQGEELELIEWLGALEIPVLVVLTKADKLSKSQRVPAAHKVRRALGLPREPLLFSATQADGVAELWRAIGHMV